MPESGPRTVADPAAPRSADPRPGLLDRIPAPILVISAIASVQAGSAIARNLFDQMSTSGVLFLRLSIAAVVMLAVVRPRVRSWSRSTWFAVLLMGVCVAALNQVFYLAIAHIPLGIAVTIEFLGPLLLSVVQTRRPTDLVWAALALAGVAILGLGSGTGSGAISALGVGLALLSGLLWAMYILASARLGAALPGMDGLAVSITVAAIIILPLGGRDALVALHEPSLLMTAALVALLSSVICYSFEMTALRRLPTRVFGILMSIEPAAAAIAGLVILGQALAPSQLLALVLVTLASAGVTLTATRRASPPSAQLT
ncbi:MAG TPA: EamA family transporter [Candidatus Nanopelagicales bacterium]